MELPGLAASKLLKAVGLVSKAPKVASPTPIPTRSDAAAIARIDALRGRRGGAADFLTGTGGAEAAPASIKQLLGE